MKSSRLKYSAGVLASLPAQRRFYQRLLLELGWPVFYLGELSGFQDQDPSLATFWLIHLDDELEVPDWSYDHPCAIFFDGELPELDSVDGRRMIKKLVNSLATHGVLASPDAYADAPLPDLMVSQQASSVEDIRQVWLILASTGGPQAVKQFLNRLPEQLPVSFIYAQHIELTGWNTLLTSLQNHKRLQVQALRGQQNLRAGRLYLAPINQALVFYSAKQVGTVKEAWQTPYAPNFNQLVASAAAVIKERLGVLVFSGMDNDGSLSAEHVIEQGGQIWTQALASCQQPSMPESFNTQSVVSRSGTPFQLARWLVEQVPSKENK